MENKALEMHKQWNGKLETVAKSKVKSREDLAIAYTPGVAEPCKVIAKDPEAAYTYTMKEQLLSAVCVYAAQFVGRNRFYLIIKACMNHEFSMSGDFRHFLSSIRCFCLLFRRMPNISFSASAL